MLAAAVIGVSVAFIIEMVSPRRWSSAKRMIVGSLCALAAMILVVTFYS